MTPFISATFSSINVRPCYWVTMEVWEFFGSVLMALMASEREKGICLLPRSFLRIRGPGLVKQSRFRMWTQLHPLHN